MTQDAEPPVETVAQGVIDRVRQLRRDRGMSTQRLANRCRELGYPELTRDRLASLETRKRRQLGVSELLVLALALDVAPVHLLAPLEDDREVALTDSITVTAAQLRLWIRGSWFPSGIDPRRYYSQVPESEYGGVVIGESGHRAIGQAMLRQAIERQAQRDKGEGNHGQHPAET